MGFYQNAEEQVREAQRSAEDLVRLAEVTSLSGDKRAKVTFYGETSESGKTYAYIDGYIPKVGDKVLMIRQGNTYVIIGAAVSTGVKRKYADIDHKHEGEYADIEHGHSELSYNFNGVTYKIAFSGTGVLAPTTNKTIQIGLNTNKIKLIHTSAINSETFYDPAYITAGTQESHKVTYTNKQIYPATSEEISIGTSAKKFKEIHAKNIYANGTAVTSDRRKKKSITNIAGKYIDFFKKLRPVTFRYKHGSGRLHAGFIAQDVEKALYESRMSTKDFGGLVIQENGEYGLRYDEFIAIQTKIIQELIERVEKLERRVYDK